MKKRDGLYYFEDMTPQELRTLQLKLVGILEELDHFCREHNLRYYLMGGTCIGAIRHKGFIPWDDDLDVAMPREDFETMFRLWDNENNRYKVLRPSRDVLTGVHIGQIRDSETTCIYDYARNYDICQGVKIDVEPVDGAPNSLFAQKIQRFHCLVYGLMTGQRPPNHGSDARRLFARIVLSLIRSPQLRYKLFRAAERKIRKYKFENCEKVRVSYNHIYDKKMLGEPCMKEFEGKLYPVPGDYEGYLRNEYGDYMQFPPENERKPVTKVFFYDPDTPHIKYKGIKYCVKKK